MPVHMLRLAMALLVFALLPIPSPAHVIIGCSPAATNAPNTVDSCSFSTPLPDNDPVPAPGVSPNTGSIVKTFFDETKPLDIEFFPLPAFPGDTTPTEYVVSEFVTNSTGVPWTDYHILLGEGTGESFVPTTTFADFDDPDGTFPLSSDIFSIATLVSPLELKFEGGVVAPGATVGFVFALDVLGGFTLRQLPSVETNGIPEPGSLALLALGAAGLLLGPRRRTHRAV